MEATMKIFNFDHEPERRACDGDPVHETLLDFQRIFTEDMAALQLLALLLTADPAKAEQCVVAGLEESVDDNPVFKNWARSWSKRVILCNAIKLMSPVPTPLETPISGSYFGDVSWGKDAWTKAILQLPTFERFVFVILALEGYSELDCANLLGCTTDELSRARSRATQVLNFV
jgi:hypothetical protein